MGAKISRTTLRLRRGADGTSALPASWGLLPRIPVHDANSTTIAKETIQELHE